MNIAEARTWLTGSAGVRYLAAIDEATDEALAAAAANVRGMSAFPSSTVSQLRGLVTRLERAQDAFNRESNLIVSGRARDGRAVLSACRQYVAALVSLEEANVRHGAFVDARVAELAAALAAAYVSRATALRRLLQESLASLEALRDALQRARRDIDDATLQLIINGTITVVSLMLPEFSLPVRVAIATGSVVTAALIDASLGPTGPSAEGTAVGALGAYVEFVPRVGPLVQRFVSTTASFNSARSDAEEIEAAERILIDIERRLSDLRRTLPDLIRRVRSETGSIGTARELYAGAVRRARSQADRYRSTESEYRVLMRELASIR